MIRRRFTLVTLVALLGVALASTPASAAEVSVTIDNVTYTADDTNIAAGATITSSATPPTSLVIPSTVDIGGHT